MRRESVTTALDLAGIGLIAAGFGLILWPLALVVAGVGLLTISWRWSR